MGIKISNEIQDEFKELMITHGFKKRGKAYFRVIGDGILQVVKYNYEIHMQDYILSFGLFSMYGELLPQEFTSSGCIPGFSIMLCVGFEGPSLSINVKGTWHSRMIDNSEQLYILKEYGFDYLDKILTQEDLIREMLYLEKIESYRPDNTWFPIEDIIPYWIGREICKKEEFLGIIEYGLDRLEKIKLSEKEPIWIDMKKFAPFLKTGDTESAGKVIQKHLDLHEEALKSRKRYLKDEEYSAYEKSVEEEISILMKKLNLTKSNDVRKIDEYLNNNYHQNLEYAKFCMKKK